MSELNINNLEWVVDQISYINNPIVFDNYNLERYLYDKNINISVVSNDYFLDLANSYSNISFDNLLSALNMQEELVNKIGENIFCYAVYRKCITKKIWTKASRKTTKQAT